MIRLPFLQFVDPLPHFAAGLRVNAKAGGNLLIKAVPVQQIAVSTGTPLATGIVGSAPDIGKGTYSAYAISTDNGAKFGPAMWPAQTIEASVGHQLTVQYQNDLIGMTYDKYNILADQTLLMNGYPQNGNIYTDPYTGPIPMVTHLHGGEMPSNSDGGPTAWFMPGPNPLVGPGFQFNASTLATYPNQQESGTLWYHPHDQGLTRINVYTGLAGFYFLRGADEEAAKVPGWSGDDKVREVTPAGKSPTFNGANTYLPEIEIGIQDRMFNTNGELYWPVNPTNADKHPFWTPEFFGDVMVVNGKTWPYLSVAPRKYRFRMLDGCNARFLNMWLQDLSSGTTAPAITVIGSDGAFLDTPVVLDFASGGTLFMAPGERYDVIIDFSGVPAGTTFTLMNDANAPYPTGDPVVIGLTDRIMQFVVNGIMKSAADTSLPGIDKSVLPVNARPVNAMVKLTDFAGNLTAGVVPDVKRQIILNEVSGPGGPVQVLFNNSHFDASSIIAGAPLEFGGPTETPTEGTTELISIINTTVDGHPIHVHLTQWQLVSRQAFDVNAYMAAYSTAWASRNVPEFPAGQGYPGGGGSPMPYDTPNDDGAVGGNPAITPFLVDGTLRPADPWERVWKDDVKAIPGEVATYIVRYAPTDRPINATPSQLLYSFDPSLGPGYVWHCHIIDHEDMDMMRPLMIQPSPLRFPQITVQPLPVIACTGDAVAYSVTATSATPITYQWQISGDAGVTWTNIVNGAPYSGALTSSLSISPADLSLTGKMYRCILTNIDGIAFSNEVLMTVNNCSLSGTVRYNNAASDPLAGFTVTVNGLSATTNASGGFIINGMKSGTYPVIVKDNGFATGGINATDAGSLRAWAANRTPVPNVRILSGDVNNDKLISLLDPSGIQTSFVRQKAFINPWAFWKAGVSGTTYPPALNVSVTGTSVTGFDILGMCTGDFNSSFDLNGMGENSNVTLSPTGNTLTFPLLRIFTLPVKAVSSMKVGAISLILNVPYDLVRVMGVRVPGSTGAVNFNVNGDELRIAWSSTTPVNVSAGGNLVELSLLPTLAFNDMQILNAGLVASYLNELADGNFVPIMNADLKVDAVEVNALGIPNPLKLYAYPNPATTMTTISYRLPLPGIVNLGIYNVLGNKVKTLIPNLSQLAGDYSLNTDVSSLRSGIYYLRITLKSGTTNLVRTTNSD